jgi:hypothetical protein
VITESLVGPNNQTVTSTKYFGSLTVVTPDNGIGILKIIMGWNAFIETPIYPIAVYVHDGGAIGFFLVSGAMVYRIEQTNDAIYTSEHIDWQVLGDDTRFEDALVNSVAGATGLRTLGMLFAPSTFVITHSQARK